MTNTHIIFVLIKNEFLVLFIDGVVGQMHTDILHVLFIRRNIGLCSKSAQTFAEDEDSKRVNTSN